MLISFKYLNSSLLTLMLTARVNEWKVECNFSLRNSGNELSGVQTSAFGVFFPLLK